MTTAVLGESTAIAPADLRAPSLATPSARLTVALGEYDTGWHDPKASLAAASRLVRRVAEVGADLVVLPELATTGATTEAERAVPVRSADHRHALGTEQTVDLLVGEALGAHA